MGFFRTGSATKFAPNPIRLIFTVLVLAACVLALRPHLDAMTPTDVLGAFAEIPLVAWVGALAATAASFAALGFYDVLIHRWLGTGIPTARSALSGVAGIGVSQTVGFGLLSGTVARARLLPEMRVFDVGRVTLAVAVSFLMALVIVTALSLSLFSQPANVPAWIGPAALILIPSVIAASLLQPRWLPFKMPSLPIVLGIFLATLIDTGFAALAFWLLLPDGASVAFAVLVPAFLLALGAGIASGTPAGLGPFELTLLALLPVVPEPELLCAIVAFRLVYFAVPASLSAIGLVLGPRWVRQTPPASPRSTQPVQWAEAGLAHQGELAVTGLEDGQMLTGTTGQCLVALGAPLSGGHLSPKTLSTLGTFARGRGLIPALYKCSARSAVAARRLGWSAVHVSNELVVDAVGYTTDVPSRSRLRRKLRAAKKAGITIRVAGPDMSIQEMTHVARDWAKARGGEQGFSMGRFDPAYVARQWVFLAYDQDGLVGFVTFHATPQEWTLDLVRVSHAATDGTVYALVNSAIEMARDTGAPRVSLAAVPAGLAKRLGDKLGMSSGLTQFKSAFAPKPEPLYLTAPGPVRLALAALDITRRVQRPLPLKSPLKASNWAKKDYDEIEFAKQTVLEHQPATHLQP